MATAHTSVRLLHLSARCIRWLAVSVRSLHALARCAGPLASSARSLRLCARSVRLSVRSLRLCAGSLRLSRSLPSARCVRPLAAAVSCSAVFPCSAAAAAAVAGSAKAVRHPDLQMVAPLVNPTRHLWRKLRRIRMHSLMASWSQIFCSPLGTWLRKAHCIHGWRLVRLWQICGTWHTSDRRTCAQSPSWVQRRND